MPIVKSHGSSYVEPERHDELSDGVAAQRQASSEHKPGGGLRKGASRVPSMGGKAHKNTTHLSHRIASAGLPDAYRRRASYFRRATCSELAKTVGGGVCGIIPSLFVKHASVATALAEQALDAGDAAAAVRYAEASRMHLIYAREVCAKDAAARPKVAPVRRPLSPEQIAAWRTPTVETKPKDPST